MAAQPGRALPRLCNSSRVSNTTSTPQPLRLAVTLPTFAAGAPSSWESLFARASAAEAAGVDRLLVSDHVAFGSDLTAYGDPRVGGVAGGRQPTGPAGHWLEPLTVLTAVAARTSRIGLGTNILLAALRRPVVLHKTVATLDALSAGRFEMGVGVGWQRAEYEAAGLEFAKRGELLDHSLAVLQALWGAQPAAFADDLLGFSDISSQPSRRIPLWISGTANPRVAQRLARFGAGWIPWGPAAADLAAGIDALAPLVADAGGDLRRLRIMANLAVRSAPGADPTDADFAAAMGPIAALTALGATDFHLSVRLSDESRAQELYAGAVSAFRTATGTFIR